MYETKHYKETEGNTITLYHCSTFHSIIKLKTSRYICSRENTILVIVTFLFSDFSTDRFLACTIYTKK
jgi:hypothetical protein